MKKIILLTLAGLLTLNIAFAQSTDNKSLLWEVSGNGLTAPSYLFGTYHFAGKNFVDSLPYIKKYFGNCKTVVGEVVIDMTDTQSLAGSMMLPADITLDKILGADDFALVANYITQITGSPAAEHIKHLKPAAVQMMLLAHIMPKAISADNPGIDGYFQEEGKISEDKILGLETMKEQSDLIFNSPVDEQKKALLQSIRNKDKEKANGLKLYQLYLQQDLDGMEKQIQSAMGQEESSDFGDRMLKNRNLNWMKKLPAILTEQPTFVVVGAAHLIGQYGLINQLRLKGYTLKPLKS